MYVLLQLRVLRLDFLQDRNVGVAIFPEIFPEGEEILVLGTALAASPEKT
jgi:hypothetical protein